MQIRFISSLTAEDEDAFAPAILKAVGTLLDQLPIAYTIRIETSGAHVYQHTHVVPEEKDGNSTRANDSFVSAATSFSVRGRSES